MSQKAISAKPVKQGVEIQEQSAGSDTTRTLIPLPEEVTKEWDLKYDDYVRVSIVTDGDDVPRVTVAPMQDISYRERNNDLKLTTNDTVALPRRIVRAFGLTGDVWWDEFDEQLVGFFTSYNNSNTLYEVADYYQRNRIPGKEDQRTTFKQLKEIANQKYEYNERNPHGIVSQRGTIRHTIPEEIHIQETDSLVFTMFHDGDDFIIGLLPRKDDEDEDSSTPSVMSQGSLKAQPGSHLEQLPNALLNYEKDKVRIHRDDSDGTIYYTFPKQIASCLWLEDGYVSDWIQVGAAHFATLTPTDSEKVQSRADPTKRPE